MAFADDPLANYAGAVRHAEGLEVRLKAQAATITDLRAQRDHALRLLDYWRNRALTGKVGPDAP